MPKDARSTKLAGLEDDMEAALEALAMELGALNAAPAGVAAPRRPALPTGPITPAAIASILGAMLPENAIVVDESVTTGREFFPETAGAPPHDWINNRGGSIGYATPVAVGAAIACPDRKVVALVGDGSAMYTLQALWTMAREGLAVTVLIFANGTYNILRGELTNVGVRNPGPRAVDMLTIGRPDIDWVPLARGMGVEGGRAKTCEQLAKGLSNGLRSQGPYLVEVAL
jgi:acetolactate synthase-1/2/3 large subunit